MNIFYNIYKKYILLEKEDNIKSNEEIVKKRKIRSKEEILVKKRKIRSKEEIKLDIDKIHRENKEPYSLPEIIDLFRLSEELNGNIASEEDVLMLVSLDYYY